MRITAVYPHSHAGGPAPAPGRHLVQQPHVCRSARPVWHAIPTLALRVMQSSRRRRNGRNSRVMSRRPGVKCQEAICEHLDGQSAPLSGRYCQLNPQTKKWVCRPREIGIIEEVSPAFWSTRSPSLLPLSCSKPQTVPAWLHGRVVPRGDGGADKSARDEAPARQGTVGHGPLI